VQAYWRYEFVCFHEDIEIHLREPYRPESVSEVGKWQQEPTQKYKSVVKYFAVFGRALFQVEDIVACLLEPNNQIRIGPVDQSRRCSQLWPVSVELDHVLIEDCSESVHVSVALLAADNQRELFVIEPIQAEAFFVQRLSTTFPYNIDIKRYWHGHWCPCHSTHPKHEYQSVDTIGHEAESIAQLPGIERALAFVDTDTQWRVVETKWLY
jgi:hypothetical protein